MSSIKFIPRRTRALLFSGVAFALMAGAAQAQTASHDFNIPAAQASEALNAFAKQSGYRLLFPFDQVAGKTTHAIVGAMSADEALNRLLADTGLEVASREGGVITLRAPATGRGPAPAAEAKAIQEIIVTASKRAERLQDVPISITASTGADLARRGSTSIDDLTATTPGLYNSSTGGGAKNNLIIRGVATGADTGLNQTTVSLLLDDIELDAGAGGVAHTNIKITDVERVEILRGPQGTLFGSGSLSGALRFISNRPNLSTFGAAVNATVSSTRQGDESYDIDGMLNVPVVGAKLAVRLVGYSYDDGGWIDNLRTGKSDYNTEQTTGGRVMILAEPTDALNVLFTALRQEIDQKGSPGGFYVAPPGATDYKRAFSRDEPYAQNVKSTIYNLVAKYDFGGAVLSSNTSYLEKRSKIVRGESSYVTFLAGLFGAPGLTGLAESTIPARTRTFSQEVRLASDGDGPFRWSVGAFYQKIDGGGGQTIFAPVFVPIIGTKNLATLTSTSDQTERALTAEGVYTLGDRVDLTAGLRAGRSEVGFQTRSTGLFLTGAVSDAVVVSTVGHRTADAVNPRLAIAFRQTPGVTWYAQAARGFRSGGPNLTAGLGGGAIPTTYASDSLWSYEIGNKLRLLSGAVRMQSALYYIDWSNIQASLAANNTTYTGNAGDAEIYGFETELAANPTLWLEVGGSLSLSHGELSKDVPDLTRVTGGIGVQSGERLPASPQTQASLYAQGSLDLRGHGAYVRASYHYVGSAYTDFGKQGLTSGDFAVADLRAGVAFEQVEVIAFLNNVFDDKGLSAATDQSNLGPVVAVPATAFRIRPRTAGLTLRARF